MPLRARVAHNGPRRRRCGVGVHVKGYERLCAAWQFVHSHLWHTGRQLQDVVENTQRSEQFLRARLAIEVSIVAPYPLISGVHLP